MARKRNELKAVDRMNPGLSTDELRRYARHLSIPEFGVAAQEKLKASRVLMIGTDYFPTRYLSNDVAVWRKIPNVYGSILRFEGQVSVFAPHLGGPCYRCMSPVPPPPGLVPSCAEGGVLG